jgi:hypothetical protein
LVGGAEKNRERKIEAVVRGLAEGKAKSTKRTVKSTKKAKIERNSADRDTKDVIRRIRTSDTGAGIQKNSRPKREGLRSGWNGGILLGAVSMAGSALEPENEFSATVLVSVQIHISAAFQHFSLDDSLLFKLRDWIIVCQDKVDFSPSS